MKRPTARRPRRATGGQIIPLAAIVLLVVLSVAAVALDIGLDFDDKRQLQSTADAAAIAGTDSLLQGTAGALTAAEQYAWGSLHLAPTINCPTAPSTTQCVITFDGYTITASTGASLTLADSAYSSATAVGVDITHNKPTVGFGGLLGWGSTTIISHAVAFAQPGSRNFPFALATRYLDITGGTDIVTYGAVLVGQCSNGGTGNFSDHNKNGGVYLNGGTNLDLASAKDSAGTYYTSAQALLLSDPNSVSSCSSTGNSNANSGWSTFGDKVSFNSSDTNYNFTFGFNAGPTGCSSSGSPPATCQVTSYGALPSPWMDNCWTNSSQVRLSSNIYDQGGAFPSGAGTVTTCTAGAVPPASHEGSFTNSNFPGFPTYAEPQGLVNTDIAGGSIPSIPSSCGGGGYTCRSINFTGNNFTATKYSYFNGITGSIPAKANFVFPSGWYVFDGNMNLNFNNNSANWTCQAPGAGDIGGCVFIFKNGAALDLAKGTLGCGGANYGCAFDFTDTGSSTNSYLALTGGLAVTMHPITYSDSTGSHKMPVIVSHQSADCLGGPLKCAIALSQSSTYDLEGTIYVPTGIADVNANGSPESGQLIADTIRLQGGSVAAGAVAYNGGVVAPILGPASLIE